MANNYFSFKQFTVQQDKSAMKVCTDACLFGAFVADKIQAANDSSIENILDIGCGTGLLSLMLAQKTNAHIDAVEIDEYAYHQAKENFSESPWQQRLTAHHADITKASPDHQFDVILSNPPFFHQSLQSDDKRKNIAKHTTYLSFEELASIASSLLKKNGKFFVLLPYSIFGDFEKHANSYGLYLLEQLHVKQTTQHDYFRTSGIFSKEPAKEVARGTLAIKENDQITAKFFSLLQDYYLYL